jgi:hypothetical protein
LESADETLLFAIGERGLRPFFLAAEGRARRARGVEARETVEVCRADEEGVRQQHEQHEAARAARTSFLKVVET